MNQPVNTWSRRRAAVQAEADDDQKALVQAEAAQARAEMATKSDADILLELDLKDPDQLQQGDNFAAFMQAEVPERLRRRALRTLWRSNPVLACVDDLVEYGEDFKAGWNSAGLIKTVYRVGKGMLPDEPEPDAEKDSVTDPVTDPVTESVTEAAEEPTEEAETTSEATGESASEPTSETAEEPQMTEAPETVDENQPQQIVQQAQMPPMRRMRFEFDEVS